MLSIVISTVLLFVTREIFTAWKDKKQMGAEKVKRLEQDAFVAVVLFRATMFILVFNPMIVTSMVVLCLKYR